MNSRGIIKSLKLYAHLGCLRGSRAIIRFSKEFMIMKAYDLLNNINERMIKSIISHIYNRLIKSSSGGP